MFNWEVDVHYLDENVVSCNKKTCQFKANMAWTRRPKKTDWWGKLYFYRLTESKTFARFMRNFQA